MVHVDYYAFVLKSMCLPNHISTCMTHPLGHQCSPLDSTHGATYWYKQGVCVAVRVDGLAQCNASMVSHGMLQHTMCRTNPLWCTWVHGMEHVHGMGRASWWS